MNENTRSDNIKTKIETAKMNSLFTESSENKNKAVFIKGKTNLDALWQELDEIFTTREKTKPFNDLIKREFISTLRNSKREVNSSENKKYDDVIDEFIECIPNPAIKELIDSYINQRPSMLFTILDENDHETINQLYLCENKTIDGAVDLVPTSNILYNDKSLNFIKTLHDKIKVPDLGSWVASEGIVESEIDETFLNFYITTEALYFTQ